MKKPQWWVNWRNRCARRSLEVFLYNFGPYPKWKKVSDENRERGVWKRYPL